MKKINEKLSSVDLFSPAIFFPVVLVFYHLFGNLADFHRSDIFDLKYSTYPLILTAFIVYYLVYYFVTKKNIMLPTIRISWFSKLFFIGIIALTVVGFLSLGYMIATGQIGILDESIRRNIDPKLNFLSAFLWFGYLILVTEFITRKQLPRNKAIIVLFSSSIIILGLYVLIGYRTNLFMIIFTLILFFHYYFKRFNFKLVILILVTFSITLSLFGYLRVVNEDKTIEFNKAPVQQVEVDSQTQKEIVRINETPKWFRVVTAEFVNGKIVLSRIVQHTNDIGSLNGKLHFSAIETILPGTNSSPRAIVTEKVNHFSDNGIPVTREGRTTTPSLLGQLYLDGGYILLIIGVGLISLLLTSIYNKMKSLGENHFKIAYSFLTTLLVISIHTGLLDVIFYIFFIAMIVYSLIEINKKDKQKEAI